MEKENGRCGECGKVIEFGLRRCIECGTKSRNNYRNKIEHMFNEHQIRVLKILTANMKVKMKMTEFGNKLRVLDILVYLSKQDLRDSEKKTKAKVLYGISDLEDMTNLYTETRIKRIAVKDGWSEEYVGEESKRYYKTANNTVIKRDLAALLEREESCVDYRFVVLDQGKIVRFGEDEKGKSKVWRITESGMVFLLVYMSAVVTGGK